MKDIVDSFIEQLKERFGNRILGAYLFGSTAKGTASSESDIDVLIVYSDLKERDLLDATSEISFRLACEEGKLIEAITISKQEFEQSLGRSPFLWEVLKFGKPIFTTLTGTEWKLDFTDYLELAEEYLNYAKEALSQGKLRLAIDSGYNSCELLVKALIISTGSSLSSSHGGIVAQFGKLFVLTGELPQDLGRTLNLSLEFRAKARYKPRAGLSHGDTEVVVGLAEELLKIARHRLAGGRGNEE
ncbi:MAG: HEPN domain-containing protein [Thermodesulfobacteriota bacterium]